MWVLKKKIHHSIKGTSLIIKLFKHVHNKIGLWCKNAHLIGTNWKFLILKVLQHQLHSQHLNVFKGKTFSTLNSIRFDVKIFTEWLERLRGHFKYFLLGLKWKELEKRTLDSSHIKLRIFFSYFSTIFFYKFFVKKWANYKKIKL